MKQLRKIFSIIPLGYKLKVFLIGIIIILATYCDTSFFIKLGYLFNDISNGKISSTSQGVMPVFVLALLFFLSNSLHNFFLFYERKVSAELKSYFRYKSIEKILKCKIKFLSRALAGEQTAQIARGINCVQGLLECLIDGFAWIIISAIVSFYQMTRVSNIYITSILLAYVFISLFVSGLFVKFMKKPKRMFIDLENNFSGQINQTIQNTEFIRSIFGIKYEKNRMKQKIDEVCKVDKKYLALVYAQEYSGKSLYLITLVILIFTFLSFIEKGQVAVGGAISTLLIFEKLSNQIKALAFEITYFATYIIEAEQFVNFYNNEEDGFLDSVPSNDDKKSTFSDNLITFKKVSSLNPEENKILGEYDDIVIDATKITGLRGTTGSGKTTLIRTLVRYYPYKEGAITVFGKDLRTLSHKELTDMVLYLPQTSFFFIGTVKENLIYGLDKELDDETLIDVLRKTSLVGSVKGRIMTNEKKVLDYELTEGALNLSGGQRQRLALARAFLRTPKLFIFDESSANLDKKTTNTVLTNIETYAKSIGAGIVYISHDINVLSRCDEIIDISKDNKANNS